MNVSKFFMSQKSKVISAGLVTSEKSNEYSKNIYLLPLPKDKITEFGFDISPAHAGNLVNSIDFYVPEGTPIFAAASGIVIKVMDNSRSRGNTIEYWDRGNFIEIKHKNGESTHYEHLRYKGVKAKIGQKVTAGEIIGLSGNTGFTEKPHLHFQVNRYIGKENFVTLKARFSNFIDVYKPRNAH
jgi:murein DD-endopeptidase MepM/ murein hydrolase activator NlpD